MLAQLLLTSNRLASRIETRRPEDEVVGTEPKDIRDRAAIQRGHDIPDDLGRFDGRRVHRLRILPTLEQLSLETGLSCYHRLDTDSSILW
jgi:hypothetical protein